MAVAKESQNDRTDVKVYVQVLLYESILIYLHVTIRAGLFQSWLMLSQLNFTCIQMFLTAFVCVFGDYSNSEQKAKQFTCPCLAK